MAQEFNCGGSFELSCVVGTPFSGSIITTLSGYLYLRGTKNAPEKYKRYKYSHDYVCNLSKYFIQLNTERLNDSVSN